VNPVSSEISNVECGACDHTRAEFSVPVPWSDTLAAAHLPCEVRATIVGPAAAPTIVVLGGISASADVIQNADGTPGWWGSLFEGDFALGSRHRIVGIDFAADIEGSFAPSPHDQAEIVDATMKAIGLAEPNAIVGASYGGMVALAYAERFQPKHTELVIISADDRPHPNSTAFRSLQRLLVDLGMKNGCARETLAIARGFAMMSYRTPAEFRQRFAGGIADTQPLASSQPGNYLKARGEAFALAMSPGRFLSLSASIDRQRLDVTAIRNRALLIGVEEDQVVPPVQMREMAGRWGGECHLHFIRSIYGHDAFLKETPTLAGLIGQFL
jgi:homoserine O-acetyltransferase